ETHACSQPHGPHAHERTCGGITLPWLGRLRLVTARGARSGGSRRRGCWLCDTVGQLVELILLDLSSRRGLLRKRVCTPGLDVLGRRDLDLGRGGLDEARVEVDGLRAVSAQALGLCPRVEERGIRLDRVALLE